MRQQDERDGSSVAIAICIAVLAVVAGLTTWLFKTERDRRIRAELAERDAQEKARQAILAAREAQTAAEDSSEKLRGFSPDAEPSGGQPPGSR